MKHILALSHLLLVGGLYYSVHCSKQVSG